jgi:hypothetical protein
LNWASLKYKFAIASRPTCLVHLHHLWFYHRNNIWWWVRIVKHASGVALREWKDKRSVLFILTEFEDVMVDTTVKRGQQQWSQKEYSRYYEHVVGVDWQEQILSYLPCEMKTVEWCKKTEMHDAECTKFAFQILWRNCIILNFLLYYTCGLHTLLQQ